jgi:hypothetical protein
MIEEVKERNAFCVHRGPSQSAHYKVNKFKMINTVHSQLPIPWV